MPPIPVLVSGRQQKKKVLQISDDLNLAITRLLLLRNQGYLAEHLFSRQVAGFADLDRFELFLLCQSITPQQAGPIIARIRRDVPLARILRVRSDEPEREQQADLNLAPPARPLELLDSLESLAITPTFRCSLGAVTAAD